MNSSLTFEVKLRVAKKKNLPHSAIVVIDHRQKHTVVVCVLLNRVKEKYDRNGFNFHYVFLMV